MMSACLEAYRSTSDFWWYEQAQRAFDWFIGWNDLGLGAVFVEHRRLSRRAACRPGQPQPGSGVHSRVPPLSRRTTADAKHGHQLQDSDRDRELKPSISQSCMSIESIHIKRATIALRPDQSRVLLRPFNPGDARRIERIVERILSLPESCVPELLDKVL